MSKYVIDSATLTGIANAIREKTQTAASIRTSDMAKRILGIDEQFTTNSDVAYTKNVPSRALSYAKVSRVGGMTYHVSGALRHSPVTAVQSMSGGSVIGGIAIPTAVRSLDGYGWGLDSSTYNYVDFEQKKFVKNVTSINLGTLNWVKNSAKTGDGSYIFFVYDLPSVVNKVLIPGYTTKTGNIAWETLNNGECLANSTYFIVATKSYSSASAFKTAMSGVIAYYDLATPVATDISDLLEGSHILPVTPGGTVTMVNDYQQAVPSTIVYQTIA